MNAEIENETNSQNTVEQNQENGTAGQSGATTPATDASAPTASCVELVSSTSAPISDDLPQRETRNSGPQTKSAELVTGLLPGTTARTAALVDAAETPETGTPSLEASDTPPEPGTLAPPRGAHRTRRGRIATLPPALRTWVNEQLVAQVPTRVIREHLAEQGHPGINDGSLHTWRTGGFLDYLKEAESTSERDRRWNSLVNLARAQGASVSAVSVQMALSHHHQLLANFDLTQASELLTQKPEYFFRLNSSLSDLIRVNEVLKKNCDLTRVKPTRTLSATATGGEREKNGGLTLGARAKVCKRLGIPHPPVRNPEAIEPEPEQQQPE